MSPLSALSAGEKRTKHITSWRSADVEWSLFVVHSAPPICTGKGNIRASMMVFLKQFQKSTQCFKASKIGSNIFVTCPVYHPVSYLFHIMFLHKLKQALQATQTDSHALGLDVLFWKGINHFSAIKWQQTTPQINQLNCCYCYVLFNEEQECWGLANLQ